MGAGESCSSSCAQGDQDQFHILKASGGGAEREALQTPPPPPRSVPPLRSRLKVRDGGLVQAELLWTIGTAAARRRERKRCTPYLTTDASMAANVEDKPDTRPRRSSKTRNGRDARQVAYRRGTPQPIKS